jgi:hypothetical protein
MTFRIDESEVLDVRSVTIAEVKVGDHVLHKDCAIGYVKHVREESIAVVFRTETYQRGKIWDFYRVGLHPTQDRLFISKALAKLMREIGLEGIRQVHLAREVK